MESYLFDGEGVASGQRKKDAYQEANYVARSHHGNYRY
jgi:hypothetical protein